jgi:membrane-associated phospholipid phosphatase
MTRHVAYAIVALCVVPGRLCAADRRIEDGWPSDYRRIEPAEIAVIGALGIGAALVELVVEAPRTPRWNSPILFDEGARNLLRAGSPGGRSRAATASDIGYLGVPAYAIGVEAGLVTWLGKDKSDAALQLALIHAEALAVNAFVSRITQKSVGRSRPDKLPTTTDNTAFFSGHTSTAFTTASVLYVQHSRLAIYGNAADEIVCPAAVAVATATGLLRMVSDRHWASDVLAGALFGTLIGGGVAWAHLGRNARASPSLSLGPGGQSLVYGGAFC